MKTNKYKFFIIYQLLVNLVSFVLFGIDKKRAINHQRRIRNITLLLISLFGGSPGAIIAMKIFRHKTKKWYFVFGVPAMFCLEIFIIIYYFSMH